MNSVIICNTREDSISRLDLESYDIVTIPLRLEEKPIGPRRVFISNGEILVANNFSNSIISIEANSFKELYKFDVGSFPNDIEVQGEKVYIACSDSNAILVYNTKTLDLEYSIESNWPISIAGIKSKKLLVVANLTEGTVSLINSNTNTVVEKIKEFEEPIFVKISKDEKFIYLCESCISKECEGYLNVISTDDLTSIYKVKVGMIPTDIYEDDKVLYVANSIEGTISVVEKVGFKEIGKIRIGGIVSGVIRDKNKLIVSDLLNNKIYIINLIDYKVKVIATGKEPSAMTKFTL